MSPFDKTIRGGVRGVLRILALLSMACAPAAWAGVTVTLTAPVNGSLLVPPVNITLSANATAGQGYSVSKVEFFNGATLIGTDTTSPYSFTWNNAPSGNHVLTAKATAVKKGNPDQTATSSIVNITVNAPPIVNITSPVSGTVYGIPPPGIPVNATASDSDGSIAKVEFHSCGGGPGLLATDTTSPYSFVWTLEPPYWELFEDHGTSIYIYPVYRIVAYATDNLGAVTSTNCLFASVAPAVALTSPANGATLSAPATINLTAELTPVDAPVEKIQFYSGTTLIGEDSTAPYSLNWQNVPEGTYSLSAKVLYYSNNLGDIRPEEQASSPVNVTVSAAQPKLHFIHADHLNTPRLVANDQGQRVWQWDQTEPFGSDPVNENPSGLGAFEFPLRLPGQYFDKETNLHYNYYRDYDPIIGRYSTSDPIGLLGGINTYAYVRGDPIRHVDPRGLAVSCGDDCYRVCMYGGTWGGTYHFGELMWCFGSVPLCGAVFALGGFTLPAAGLTVACIGVVGGLCVWQKNRTCNRRCSGPNPDPRDPWDWRNPPARDRVF